MVKLIIAISFIVILSIHLISAFDDYNLSVYGEQYLSEGSSCILENGTIGECIELPKCPYRIRQVLEGKRFATSSGRCNFKKFIEIVCCPISKKTGTNLIITTTTRPTNSNDHFGSNLLEKLRLRPADTACHKYENQIQGKDWEKINTNIFNGEQALAGEFPSMVALGYLIEKDNLKLVKYNCGGTLISIQYVLTAAHCVNNIDELVPFEVKMGALALTDNSDNVQHISIAEIYTHPKYRKSKNYYDITVMKLTEAAIITKKVMPICLQTKPITNMETLLNMSLIVTGWGATSFENESSVLLQKTPKLQIVDLTTCSMKYKRSSRLPHGLDSSMICILDINITRRADACQGDSGGPLLLHSRVSSMIIGVTSFGQSCGSFIPAIYTSVLYYLDWVEEIVWPTKM